MLEGYFFILGLSTAIPHDVKKYRPLTLPTALNPPVTHSIEEARRHEKRRDLRDPGSRKYFRIVEELTI